MFIDMNGLTVNDGAHVLGGQFRGSNSEMFSGMRGDPGLMRPYFDYVPDRNGNVRMERLVTLNVGYKTDEKTGVRLPIVRPYRVDDLHRRGIFHPVHNATTMRKEDWIEIDRKVVMATRQRLRAWADLAASASRSGFDAYSKMTLEYQSTNDVGEAMVDMDAIAMGRTDRPLFDLKSIPLPITHSDFYFTDREIASSRNSGMALDARMGEMAGRRVAESVEKTTIGVETGITYGTRSGDAATAHTGTSTVYGYTNFPYRVTKTDLTTPTGTNPEGVMTDVLEMIETMQSNGYFGPYTLYHSTGYSRYLNDDYYRAGSTSAVRLLRERIMAIEGISDIRRLDYLTSGFQLILVQMDGEVAEAIEGMQITTVQWDAHGGFQKNFKVLCIMVPFLRAPYNGVAGIVHGTTS